MIFEFHAGLVTDLVTDLEIRANGSRALVTDLVTDLEIRANGFSLFSFAPFRLDLDGF
jgi:hypothetical protein